LRLIHKHAWSYQSKQHIARFSKPFSYFNFTETFNFIFFHSMHNYTALRYFKRYFLLLYLLQFYGIIDVYSRSTTSVYDKQFTQIPLCVYSNNFWSAFCVFSRTFLEKTHIFRICALKTQWFSTTKKSSKLILCGYWCIFWVFAFITMK